MHTRIIIRIGEYSNPLIISLHIEKPKCARRLLDHFASKRLSLVAILNLSEECTEQGGALARSVKRTVSTLAKARDVVVYNLQHSYFRAIGCTSPVVKTPEHFLSTTRPSTTRHTAWSKVPGQPSGGGGDIQTKD